MQKLSAHFNDISVRKGEIFAIELEGIPSAGYIWSLLLTAGKASLLGEEYIAPPAPLVGGSVKQVFTFKAEETGTIRIAGEYKRPWEAAPPLKTQNFSITVG